MTKKEVKRIVGTIIAGSAALYGVYKAFETYFYSKYNVFSNSNGVFTGYITKLF